MINASGLDWRKTPDRTLRVHWHFSAPSDDFREAALSESTMDAGGVYVICRTADGQAVRLGQATRIRDRLRAHQDDPHVVGATTDQLRVAWAWVPRAYRSGVEAYLARNLRPTVGDRFPKIAFIDVNLPEGSVRWNSPSR